MKKPLLLLTLFLTVLSFIGCQKDIDDSGIIVQDVQYELIAKDSELYQLLYDQIVTEEFVCVTFDFPFNIHIFDSNEVEIANAYIETPAHLLTIIANLNDDQYMAFEYSLSYTNTSGETANASTNANLLEPLQICKLDANNIPRNSDLFNDLLDEVSEDPDFECIEFIYPFQMFVFDENDVEINQVTINGRDTFKNELTLVQTNQSISLSFPISGVNSDGETFTINNIGELIGALRLCEQDDIIADCNGSFEQEDCTFIVEHFNANVDEDFYQNAVIKDLGEGIVELYHEGEVIRGSRTAYFINDVLHNNFNFNDGDPSNDNDPDTLENFWNHDWVVNHYSDTLITLTNSGNITINLNSSCFICDSLSFEVCGLDGNPDIADIILGEFRYCIFEQNGIFNLNQIEDYRISFHTNDADAQSNENAIITNIYNNLVNPELIYVRLENLNNGSFTVFTIEFSINNAC
ncbi:MAG: hypothetical protein HRT68_05065 [Flavobacteriaceae bacterium]|nr:hypothetical protein [Flavobacteriaceae bacterium]